MKSSTCVYIRKIDSQCVTHQISIPTDVFKNFFDNIGNNVPMNFTGVKSKKTGNVTILYATDYRFGGDIKRLINDEGGMNIGDLMVIWKKGSNYSLEMFNSSTPLTQHLTSVFDEKERHFFFNFDDSMLKNEFNVYGMHIQLKNSALDSNNPHVCIGWSNLGDLTNINTKIELKDLYKKVRPEDSNQTVGANISQIWMFKDEVKINDYVVYFNNRIAHFGKIIGNYEYVENPTDQDTDYVNNRKVEWLKDVNYEDLPLEYRKSAMAQKSIFRLNTFKPLIEEIINGQDIDKDVEENDVAEFDFSSSQFDDGYNLIVYGTPGCGKSYFVEHELLESYSKENYIRTTFYPDYTNTDFVGQILPIVEGEKVTYKFNPGPFTLALERAIRNPNERVALVIEELNRGSAASIFGDIFQLLDRKKGVSEYSITNVNIINYLNEQFKDEYTFSNIKLPGNLSIFATMNTSDQNVFTLDTAFKRRWKFKKLINEFKSDHEFQNWYIPGADITWKELVTAINDYILTVSDGLNSEDKQLGVYFVDKNCMRKEKVDPTNSKALEEFSYKVMEYLWDDVAKFQRSKWFNSDIKSLDELIKEYADSNIGLKVFNDDIFNK